jgi:hypothetical protein
MSERITTSCSVPNANQQPSVVRVAAAQLNGCLNNSRLFRGDVCFAIDDFYGRYLRENKELLRIRETVPLGVTLTLAGSDLSSKTRSDLCNCAQLLRP